MTFAAGVSRIFDPTGALVVVVVGIMVFDSVLEGIWWLAEYVIAGNRSAGRHDGRVKNGPT